MDHICRIFCVVQGNKTQNWSLNVLMNRDSEFTICNSVKQTQKVEKKKLKKSIELPPFVFDVLSASFYHRSRVSARLVTLGSRDTAANVMGWGWE
jgi:hypothetical protein